METLTTNQKSNRDLLNTDHYYNVRVYGLFFHTIFMGFNERNEGEFKGYVSGRSMFIPFEEIVIESGKDIEGTIISF